MKTQKTQFTKAHGATCNINSITCIPILPRWRITIADLSDATRRSNSGPDFLKKRKPSKQKLDRTADGRSTCVVDGGRGRVTATATALSRSNHWKSPGGYCLAGWLSGKPREEGKVWLWEHHSCLCHTFTPTHAVMFFVEKTGLYFVSLAHNTGGCLDSP